MRVALKDERRATLGPTVYPAGRGSVGVDGRVSHPS